MTWDIFFFETLRGEKLEKEFIKSLPETAVSKISHHIDLLKTYGPQLGMPHSKRLQNNLYELRIRGKNEIRIIYSFKGAKIYLLHAFKKKTQEIPEKEIKTAITRFTSLT